MALIYIDIEATSLDPRLQGLQKSLLKYNEMKEAFKGMSQAAAITAGSFKGFANACSRLPSKICEAIEKKTDVWNEEVEDPVI